MNDREALSTVVDPRENYSKESMGNSGSKSEAERESKSKVIGGTVGGATSAVTAGAGIGLMFLGPVGMIAGGVLLGAGVSSAVNTVQQVATEGEFKYGQWGTSVGIGALGGAVVAPVSVGGGLVAGAVSSTAAKVGSVVAAETVGGALSGGVINAVSKAINDEGVNEDTLKDFGKSILIGGITGLIGGAVGQAGQAAGKVAGQASLKTVGSVASTTGKAVRIAAKTVGGAAVGGGTSALVKLVENVFNRGEMKEDDLVIAMGELGYAEETAKALRTFLCENEIVVDGVVQKQVPDSLHFPEELQDCQKAIKAIIEESFNVTKGVLSSVAEGAIVGGVTAAVTAGILEHKQSKHLKKLGKARGQQIKSGAFGGTIEAEAYARQNNKRVVIHHEDGSVTTHGSKSAKGTVEMCYSAKDKHYSPVDAGGKKLIYQGSARYGDCFFEAICQLTGENPTSLRQKVGKFIAENPSQLKHTRLTELEHGGYCQGGGKNIKRRLSKVECRKIKRAIRSADINAPNADEIKQELIRDFERRGIRAVNRLSQRDFNKVGSGEYRTQRSMHGLHCGFLALDVHDRNINLNNKPVRGPYRVLLKATKRDEVEFFKFSTDHYRDVGI